MIDCMIDLETLGSRPGCQILSVGACFFSREGKLNATFHQVARLYGQSKLGLQREPATVKWWSEQPPSARELLEQCRSTKAIRLTPLLQGFGLWLLAHGDGNALVWSKGADFDIPVLTVAYSRCGIELPWKMRQARCFRTLIEECGHVPEPKRQGVQHNALDDAMHQARWAALIFKAKAKKQSAARRGV